MANESQHELILDKLEELLKKIHTDNGYHSTPEIKKGWVQQIFGKTRHSNTQFPVLFCRPELDAPNLQPEGQNKHLGSKFTIAIDGAVEAGPNSDPVADLMRLLKDVRDALVFPAYPPDPVLSKVSITLKECPFDVPDPGDNFAFFTQKIEVGINEQHANPKPGP